MLLKNSPIPLFADMTDKIQMRKICRKKRNSVADKKIKAAAASRILLESDFMQNADTVLLYSAVNSEMSTDFLFNQLIALKKNVAFPRSLDGGIMTFHIIRSPEELALGKYNIPEPPIDAPQFCCSEHTVCVVPALAFTLNGERLGYGGGYYDRFLAANPRIFTVGYTYDDMIFDSLPVLSHDLGVNAVVTEERMVLCNAK